jgi:hypothetical protein
MDQAWICDDKGPFQAEVLQALRQFIDRSESEQSCRWKGKCGQSHKLAATASPAGPRRRACPEQYLAGKKNANFRHEFGRLWVEMVCQFVLRFGSVDVCCGLLETRLRRAKRRFDLSKRGWYIRCFSTGEIAVVMGLPKTCLMVGAAFAFAVALQAIPIVEFEESRLKLDIFLESSIDSAAEFESSFFQQNGIQIGPNGEPPAIKPDRSLQTPSEPVGAILSQTSAVSRAEARRDNANSRAFRHFLGGLVPNNTGFYGGYGTIPLQIDFESSIDSLNIFTLFESAFTPVLNQLPLGSFTGSLPEFGELIAEGHNPGIFDGGSAKSAGSAAPYSDLGVLHSGDIRAPQSEATIDFTLQFLTLLADPFRFIFNHPVATLLVFSLLALVTSRKK